VTTTDLGAKFTVSEQGDAPTIESDFYIFFGHVDVKMRAANGTGIVSTYVLESDDLDEIDWVSLYPPIISHPLTIHRSKSAPGTPRSKPTTSARVTHLPTTAVQP
jgi:hypothetical protein